MGAVIVAFIIAFFGAVLMSLMHSAGKKAGESIKKKLSKDDNEARPKTRGMNEKGAPSGGDPEAVSWKVVNDRWVKNTYSNGDVTMSDRTTGLMWVHNAKKAGEKNWHDAKRYCERLTYAGHSDWRLPDKDTLKEQHNHISFFSRVQRKGYWSGTSSDYETNWALFIIMGGTDNRDKTDSYYVWPVRGGQ